MARQESVVALIGAGDGPKIPMFNRRSFVRVSGMNGGVLIVRTQDKLRREVGMPMVLKSDGEYEIPSSAYMSAACDDADKTLIVHLVRE